MTENCADKGVTDGREVTHGTSGRRKWKNGWIGRKKWNGLGSNPFVVFVVVLGQRCFRPWGNVLILSQWADGWHIFLITSLSVIDYSCLTPLPQAVSLTVHTSTFAPNAVWTPEYRIRLLLFFFLSLSFMSIKSLCPCNYSFDCNQLVAQRRKWIKASWLIEKPSEKSCYLVHDTHFAFLRFPAHMDGLSIV